MVEKYNYLVYHFVCDGCYFRARTHTEKSAPCPFGPFEGRAQ